MLETAFVSCGRFFAGKMFSDNRIMRRQLAIGVGAGAATTVAIGLVAPLWLAAMGGGAVGGFLQPLLFKHLKYA